MKGIFDLATRPLSRLASADFTAIAA